MILLADMWCGFTDLFYSTLAGHSSEKIYQIYNEIDLLLINHLMI